VPLLNWHNADRSKTTPAHTRSPNMGQFQLMFNQLSCDVRPLLSRSGDAFIKADRGKAVKPLIYGPKILP